MIIILFIYLHLLFIYAKEKPTLEDHSYRSTNTAATPIYSKNNQVTILEESIPPPKHLYRLLDKNISLNLNIAFYFLNILALPDVLKCLTTNGHRRKTIERTWHMVNRCIEMNQE